MLGTTLNLWLCKAMQAVCFQRLNMKVELEEYFSFRVIQELGPVSLTGLALTKSVISVTGCVPEAIEII